MTRREDERRDHPPGRDAPGQAARTTGVAGTGSGAIGYPGAPSGTHGPSRPVDIGEEERRQGITEQRQTSVVGNPSASRDAEAVGATSAGPSHRVGTHGSGSTTTAPGGTPGEAAESGTVGGTGGVGAGGITPSGTEPVGSPLADSGVRGAGARGEGERKEAGQASRRERDRRQD